MKIERIHKQLLSSRLLLFTIVFAFIVTRLYYIHNQWDNTILLSCLLIQIGIAFFLLQLNHIFNIIQERTFLPASFYLLFAGCYPDFCYDIKGSVAALCVVLCCYFLFKSYQKPKSQAYAMNISLLLVLGSLFWTPLLLFFPIIWIGFYHFQSLNARVFFASLTGFIIVYLFIFTWSLYQGDKNIFLSFLPQIPTLFVIHKPDLTLFEWLTCGFLLFIYLMIGINLFFFNISERRWVIAILSYFFVSSFIIFIFLLLQNEYKSSWGLIIYIPITFLMSHFFSRTNNRGIQYLLILFFLFFVGIGIIQHVSP